MVERVSIRSWCTAASRALAQAAHPVWSDVGSAVVAPNLHSSRAYLFPFIATAGTTISPFMQLYVQSAVVERGVGVDELNAEGSEVVTGSIFANLVAMSILPARPAGQVFDRVHHWRKAYPWWWPSKRPPPPTLGYWTSRELPAAISDAICWKIVWRLAGFGSG